MRLVLSAIVIFVAVNVGLSAIDSMQKIQQQKLDQYCQIDPSICDQL
jgi:hypothetical protein